MKINKVVKKVALKAIPIAAGLVVTYVVKETIKGAISSDVGFTRKAMIYVGTLIIADLAAEATREKVEYAIDFSVAFVKNLSDLRTLIKESKPE